MKTRMLSALMVILGLSLVAGFIFAARHSVKAQQETDDEAILRELEAANVASAQATENGLFYYSPASEQTSALVCPAGTSPENFYFENFEANNGGWAVTGFGDWEYGEIVTGTFEICDTTPRPEPAGAFSGSNVWANNLNGCYQNAGASSYLSKEFDFSGLATPLELSWWNWHEVFGSFDVIRVWVNGTTLWEDLSSTATPDWQMETIDLSAYAGNPSVTIQFELSATTVVNRMGWYVDDVALMDCAPSLPNVIPPTLGSVQLTNEIVTQTLTISNPTLVTLNWAFSESLTTSPDIAEVYEPLPFLPDPVSNGPANSRRATPVPLAYRWEPEGGSTFNGRVLVFSDDFVHYPNFAPQALENLHMGYTFEGSFTGFNEALTSDDWDLVIFANENFYPYTSTLDALNTYVEEGGTLIMHTWAISTTFPSGNFQNHPLWDTMGVVVTDNIGGSSTEPIYWWEPVHPFFAGVPEFTVLDNVATYSHGQKFEVLPGFTALAGYTTPGPDVGEAALVIGNGERTILRGFLDAQNSADLDSDSVYDGLELWMNMLAQYLPCGVSWASVVPTSGSTPNSDTSDVTVTFDATGLIRGLYSGHLCLETDNADAPLIQVPITMTVLGPAVALNKTVGTNPQGCSSHDSITVYGASEVTYCYEIQNTGEITLTNHTLVDSQLGILLDNYPYTLGPGQSVFITQTALIQGAALITNTATWTVDDGDGRVASDTDMAAVYMDEPMLVAVEAFNDSPTYQPDATTLTATAYITQNVMIWAEDFESGLGDWTATSLWHLEAEAAPCGSEIAPFPSSSHAAYFGNAFCTYTDTTGTVSGTLDLNAPISLMAGTSPVLSFWTYEQTECGSTSICSYDHRVIQISTDSGLSWTNIYTGGVENVWHPIVLDISAYENNDVLLRFYFDTIDNIGNGYFGWMVDDVQITINEVITVPAPVENVIYVWDFGDGQTGTGAVIPHTYAPGTYQATVTAYNSANAITANTEVTVIQTEWDIYLPLIVNGASAEAVTPTSGKMSVHLPGVFVVPGIFAVVGLSRRKKQFRA